MKNKYLQLLYYLIFLAFFLILLLPIPMLDFIIHFTKRIEIFIGYFGSFGKGFFEIVEIFTFIFFISIIVVSTKHIIKYKKQKIVAIYSSLTSISLFASFAIFIFFLIYFLNNFDIMPNLHSLNQETIASLDSDDIVDLSASFYSNNSFLYNVDNNFPIFHKIFDFLLEIIPSNIFTSFMDQRYLTILFVFVAMTIAIFTTRSYYSSSYFFSFFFSVFSVFSRLFNYVYIILPVLFITIIAFFLDYYISYLKINFKIFNSIISYKIFLFTIPVIILIIVLLFYSIIITKKMLIRKTNFSQYVFMYFELMFLSFIPVFNLISVFRLIPHFSNITRTHKKALLFPLAFDAVTFNYGKFLTSAVLIFLSLKFYLVDVSDNYIAIILSAAFCSFFPFYFSSIQLPLIFFCLSYVFNIPHYSTLLFLIPLFIILQPISNLLNITVLLFKNTLLYSYLNRKYVPTHVEDLVSKKNIVSKAPINILKSSYSVPFKWISFNIYFFVIIYSILITFIFYRSYSINKEIEMEKFTDSNKSIIRHVYKSISSRIRENLDFIHNQIRSLVDKRFINKPVNYSLEEYLRYLYENLLIKSDLVRYVSISYSSGNTYILKRVPKGSLSLLNANFRKHNIIKLEKFDKDDDIIFYDDDIVYLHQKENFNNNVCNQNTKINNTNTYWSKPIWFPLEFQPGIVACGKVIFNSRLNAYIKVGARLDDISDLLKRELPNNFNGYIFDSYSNLIATSYKYPVWRRIEKNDKVDVDLTHISNYQESILNEFHIDYIDSKSSIYENQKDNNISFIKNFRITPNIFWNIGILYNLQPNNSTDPTSYIAILLSSLLLILLIWSISFIFNRVDQSFEYINGEIAKIKNMNFKSSRNLKNIFEIREIDLINKAFIDVKKIFRIVKRYIPSSLLSHITKLESSQVKLGGVKRSLTILFTDIANFTNISEKHSLSDLLQNLSIYFTHADKVISNNQGTIDKYIGDAIMAFWGAPDRVENQAYKACISAIECNEKFLELNSNVLTIPFNTRFGLHSAKVIVGNIGSLNRLNYTVIGDGVNLASRIESLNKLYGTSILMSETVKEQVENKLEYRLLDKVAVKGKEQGTKVYQILGKKGAYPFLNYDEDLLTKIQVEGFLAFYEDALHAYFNGFFDKAIKGLKKAQKIYSDDIATDLIINRCNSLIKNPPKNLWDGVYHLDHK